MNQPKGYSKKTNEFFVEVLKGYYLEVSGNEIQNPTQLVNTQ